MARVESERLKDREPGRRTRAASLLRTPVPKLLELGLGMRVGVAAVASRVAAPGGTSGAGDRRLLARALPASRRRPVSMVTPSRRGPWNLPSGRGAARRGVARGRAQAWRRRDQVGNGAAGTSSARRGGGDCGQERPGFEPPSRAHLPAPTGALPGLSPDAGVPAAGTGEGGRGERGSRPPELQWGLLVTLVQV